MIYTKDDAGLRPAQNPVSHTDLIDNHPDENAYSTAEEDINFRKPRNTTDLSS